MELLRCAPLMRPEQIRQEVLPKRLPISVQIAGTNGKGSTAAFLADILDAHGFRVGQYTSPHISSFTERIRIGNQNISQEDLESYVGGVNALQPGMCQSDLLFLAACNYFIDQAVDFAIFETGLGGRKDSATLVPHEYGIITHIALDHTQILGDTIEQITWEKSGIIKPGMQVVAYPNQRMDIIKKEAQEQGAVLIDTNRIRLNITSEGFDMPDYVLKGLRLAMSGQHQIYNCVCAICCAQLMLRERFSPMMTKRAVEQTQVYGRMTMLQRRPLILSDVSHNPDGVDALCKEIDKLSGRKVAVVSIAEGKDYKGMISRLRYTFDQIIYTRAAEKCYAPKVFGQENAIEDFDRAYVTAQGLPFDVLVFCGSFAIVGRVKEKMGR